MIFCEISKLKRYRGIHDNLDIAIDYIQDHDLEALPLGSTAISGKDVYVNRFDYTTNDPSQLLFETHCSFADVHLILEGAEVIQTAPVDSLEKVEEDMDSDYIGSKGQETALVHMKEKTALIVFPGEAHKVMCMDEKDSFVKKAVVKVKVDSCPTMGK